MLSGLLPLGGVTVSYFNPVLFNQMRALRYAIYCYLFSATVYSAVIHNQVLSSSLCLLVVLPALVHTTIQGGLAWARFAHVLEAVALPALLYALASSCLENQSCLSFYLEHRHHIHLYLYDDICRSS